MRKPLKNAGNPAKTGSYRRGRREIFTRFAWVSRMEDEGGLSLSGQGQNPVAGKTLDLFLRAAIF